MILEEVKFDGKMLQQFAAQFDSQTPPAAQQPSARPQSSKTQWSSEEEKQTTIAKLLENMRKTYPDLPTDEQLSKMKIEPGTTFKILRCANCFYTEDPDPHPDWI